MERSDITTPSREARLLYHTEYHYCESVSSNCSLIDNCCVNYYYYVQLEICSLFVVESFNLATFLKFNPPLEMRRLKRRSFLDANTTTIEERRGRAIREGRFQVRSTVCAERQRYHLR